MVVIAPPFDLKDKKAIRRILAEENGVVVYPTETFYALGCAADSSPAVNRVYQLKKRDENEPLLVLIDCWQMFDDYFEEIDESRKKLLQKYWPGALTVVLKSRKNLAPMLNKAGPYLGVRMTSSIVAQELIKGINKPLVGTSANLSNENEIADFQQAKNVFGTLVDLYIDGGKTPGGAPSTVVDMKNDHEFTVVRKGAAPFEEFDEKKKKS